MGRSLPVDSLVRRYGQGTIARSREGLKQEGELSVFDGERSLRAGLLSMGDGRQSIAVGRVNVRSVSVKGKGKKGNLPRLSSVLVGHPQHQKSSGQVRL